MKDLLQKAFEYGQKFEGRGGDDNFSFEQFFNDNITEINDALSFKTKAESWDKLDAKIAKCYVNENGDELSEEESENIDLCTIGEISASAFGWL